MINLRPLAVRNQRYNQLVSSLHSQGHACCTRRPTLTLLAVVMDPGDTPRGQKHRRLYDGPLWQNSQRRRSARRAAPDAGNLPCCTGSEVGEANSSPKQVMIRGIPGVLGRNLRRATLWLLQARAARGERPAGEAWTNDKAARRATRDAVPRAGSAVCGSLPDCEGKNLPVLSMLLSPRTHSCIPRASALLFPITLSTS